MTFISPHERLVIMTDYGEYHPTPFELQAYMHVYAGDPGASWLPKWQEELIDYATQQTKSQFVSRLTAPSL